MRLYNWLKQKVNLWRKNRRLAKFKRRPKLFIPTPTRWQIVVPYKPLGVLMLLISAITSAYFFFRSDLFLIREIIIEELEENYPNQQNGQTLGRFVSKETLYTNVSAYQARSIFFINSNEISQKLKQIHPSISEVHLEKHLPDKIVIKVSERTPVAILKVVKDSAQQGFLIDQDGLIFSSSVKGLTLPELVLEEMPFKKGPTQIALKERIPEELVYSALQIIKGFQNIPSASLQTIIIESEDEIKVHIKTKNGNGEKETNSNEWTALFSASNHKSIEDNFASLQAILLDAKIKDKKIASVNLRFRRPVVRYR